MATHVKSTTSKLGKAKHREDGQSYGSNVGQGFFCGASFSGSMAPDETKPHMSRDHESWVASDGNQVMVLNPSEMIFTIAPMMQKEQMVLLLKLELHMQYCRCECSCFNS
jgi:hypothetical protein